MRILEHMKKERWTATALAKELNVSRTTLYRWQNDTQEISHNKLKEMAKLLKVKISDLKG